MLILILVLSQQSIATIEKLLGVVLVAFLNLGPQPAVLRDRNPSLSPDPSKAQQEMEQILTQHSNNVQGILSANDGMAGGIIAALQAQGLAGKIPITGLDATLAADQRILRGTQSMTVWRSLREEADKAAQIAAALVRGRKPPESLFPNGKTVNNGMVNVPWAPLRPIVVDRTNMAVLIQDGSIGKGQLCNGIPHGTGPC